MGSSRTTHRKLTEGKGSFSKTQVTQCFFPNNLLPPMQNSPMVNVVTSGTLSQAISLQRSSSKDSDKDPNSANDSEKYVRTTREWIYFLLNRLVGTITNEFVVIRVKQSHRIHRARILSTCIRIRTEGFNYDMFNSLSLGAVHGKIN